MIEGEVSHGRQYDYVPTRLNEAYMEVHRSLEASPYEPSQVISMTSEVLEHAGLFVAEPPSFDTAPMLDAENNRLVGGASFGVEDAQRLSRQVVATLAQAGVLDKEACRALVQ